MKKVTALLACFVLFVAAGAAGPEVGKILDDLQTQYPDAQKLVGRAADGAFWIAINETTKQVLPAGRYHFIRIGEGKVDVTTVDMLTDEPDPPPPPPDDLTKEIDGFLKMVNGDETKKQTADKIAQLYDLLVVQVEAETIKDADSIRKAANAVDTVLGLLKKDAAWKPFTTGMKGLLADKSLEECVAVLKVAAERLKGV